MCALQDNLILWYKCDDSSASTIVSDSSGNGYHGTSVRNTVDMHIAGKIDGALNFISSMNDYVDTNQIFLSTFQNSFSINLWMHPVNGEIWVFGSYDGNYEINLYIGDAAELSFTYYTISQALSSIANVIKYNKWCMVTTIVQKLTNSTLKLLIYKDGILLKQSNEISITMSNFNGTANFLIGNLTGYPENFNGYLDDFRIYNKALSADEIKQLYDEGNINQNQLNSTGEQFLSMTGV